MSNEPLIPYLPKLIGGTDDAVALPHALREWDDRQGEIRLRHLADAIEVPPGADRVHSIPDPWARVILFWRALYDRDHPLHPRVVGEWRGVLALLALKEARRISELSVFNVKLEPNQGHMESFRFAISRMLPGNEDAIIRSATWKEFDLLRWTGERTQGRERAFALTSPWTLVATGAYYADVFSRNEIPWFDGQHLTDPREHLSEDERAMVAEWLWHVRNGIPTERGAKIRDIAALLEAYARDLFPAANGSVQESDVFAERSIGLSGGALYRTIDRPCKPAARIISHCAIKTDKAGTAKHVLIDPVVTARLGRHERDVVVHRNINMATYRRMIPDMDRARTGLLPADPGQSAMRWCTADFFFEKDLIYQQTYGGSSDQETDAFPGLRKIRTQGRAQGRNFVLPIRAEVLGLFTAEELPKHLSMEWTEKGDAQFRLRLEIQALAAGSHPEDAPVPVGEVYPLDLVRNYTAAEMIQIPKLPAVCLWPDFNFEDDRTENGEGARGSERPAPRNAQTPRNRWNVYYLFESWRELGEKTDQFVVSPLPGQVVSERTLKMPTFDSGQKIGEETFQITTLTSFPEAMQCRMPFNPQRPRSQGDTAPVGLLLLNRKAPIAMQHGHPAALGVDFGTTGTSIWRSFGRAEEDNESLDISRVSFHNRIVPITRVDSGEFQRITRELFLPNTQPVNDRILSIFQDFGARGGRSAVRDGHVLFLETSGSREFVHGDPQSVLTNLKWSEERSINAATQDFLVQLCLQSLAELVVGGATSIDLRYSYPTAFSEDDLENFKGLWNAVAAQLKRATSVPIQFHTRVEDNCEAIAATRFFSHSVNERRLNVARGALTLDIGGGTTDIAVWNRHPESGRPSLLGHMSIKFAGQDIFLVPLRQRPELLAMIDDGGAVSTAIESLKARFRRGSAAYDAELDAIITAHGDELLEKLPGCAQTGGIKEFLQILDLGLCGVAFYTGLLIGRLVKDGSYDALQARIQTFVGGNGSRLFKWCALGEADRNSKIIRRFASSLLAGANLASDHKLKGNQVEVSLSSHPKEEVAFGLVMRPDRLERNDAYVNPMAGENYLVGKASERKAHSWDTAPDLQTLGTLPVHVDPQLQVVKAFLEVMELHLSNDELDDVANAVDTGINNMAVIAERALENRSENQKKDPVRKQPLFILALKHLITDRIRRLAQIKLVES